MKTKLFENVGGNNFKLLKENVETKSVNESLVASGLKKVFMNAGKSISYNHVESVGMGYIKDIVTAKRVALDEARILAKEFGYKDSEDDAKFVKDSANVRPLKQENDETNMNIPVEKREVQIGKRILEICEGETELSHNQVVQICKLAQELLKIHGQQ